MIYHEYSTRFLEEKNVLPRPTTINQKQTKKQLLLTQDVCVGIDTGSGCLGDWKTFGIHPFNKSSSI